MADSGDQIWVAEGTYRPSADTSDVMASFQLGDGVEVYGGFAGTETSLAERDFKLHVTVLSGDLAGDDDPAAFKAGQKTQDNVGHVVIAKGVGPTSLLDGVTITGGIGRVLEGACDPHVGGGLAILDGSPTVRNCSLSFNQSDYGGGCYVGGDGSPMLLQCEFIGNFSKANGFSALWICHSSMITLEGCRFEANGVNNSGGALGLFTSNVVIRRCEFTNNTSNWAGAAVDALGDSQILIEDSRFFGNRAQIGAALHADSASFQLDNDIVVKNSVFSGNESLGSYGGAIWINTSTVTIENCTIVNNRSYFTSLGAGIAVEGLSPDVLVKNTIVWGNSADRDLGESSQIWDGMEFFDLHVEHSCVQGLGPIYDGNGNIGTDPLLVDSVGEDGVAGTGDDDVTLSRASPCVDAADPMSNIRGTDLVGGPRLIDGNLDGLMVADMGATEYSSIRLHAEVVGADTEQVTIAIDADVPLWGYLVVGLDEGDLLVPPFGSVFVEMTQPFSRIEVGVLPFADQFVIPDDPALPREILLQAVGVIPAQGVGNVSNAVWLDL